MPGLEDLLLNARSSIIARWFARIVKTYPADSQKFIKEEKNRFANPVGSTILQGIEDLYAELLREMNPERLKELLDPVIRIQAVQGFSPSRALSFIPSLKEIIREQLGKEIQENQLLAEFFEFASRIDQLTLLAFDLYMGCREKIYEIRVQELRNRAAGPMERIQTRGMKRGANLDSAKGEDSEE